MIVKGLRARKIEIETFKHGEDPFIHIRAEHIDVDDQTGEILSTGKQEIVHRPFSQVYTEMVTVDDPLLGPVTVSVAGLAELIRHAAIAWYGEDFGTEYNATIKKAVFPE